MTTVRTHRPPTTCPVCSQSLIALRLGCPGCGTEVSGHFDTCRYCRLDAQDQQILEVFLRSRGNLRDVQAHLGVSYPTARARLGEMLDKLGLAAPPDAAPAARPLVGPGPAPLPAAPQPPAASQVAGPLPPTPATTVTRASLLADLAAGRIDVATAEALLRP